MGTASKAARNRRIAPPQSRITRSTIADQPSARVKAQGIDPSPAVRQYPAAVGTASIPSVIEPIEAVESLLKLEDELLAELMSAVKRAAQEIVRVHGACRVHTDLGGHNNRLRWHVYAPPS